MTGSPNEKTSTVDSTKLIKAIAFAADSSAGGAVARL